VRDALLDFRIGAEEIEKHQRPFIAVLPHRPGATRGGEASPARTRLDRAGLFFLGHGHHRLDPDCRIDQLFMTSRIAPTTSSGAIVFRQFR
jgi:hypothetical protein